MGYNAKKYEVQCLETSFPDINGPIFHIKVRRRDHRQVGQDQPVDSSGLLPEGLQEGRPRNAGGCGQEDQGGHMGWIGSNNELMHVLRTFGVDRDEDGKFHVDGKIVSFMGAGEEMVVGDNAVAYIDGKPRNICNMLEVTSYGLKVKVI